MARTKDGKRIDSKQGLKGVVPPVPEGWEQVTTGKLRAGDQIAKFRKGLNKPAEFVDVDLNADYLTAEMYRLVIRGKVVEKG